MTHSIHGRCVRKPSMIFVSSPRHTPNQTVSQYDLFSLATNSAVFMLGHAIIADTNLHGTSRHAFIRLAIYTANIVLSYRHMQFSQIHIFDISAHCEHFKQNLFTLLTIIHNMCRIFIYRYNMIHINNICRSEGNFSENIS